MLASVLGLSACAQKQAIDPHAGKVNMALRAQGHTADSSATPAVCATFSLTPYALGAGGSQTLAGSPVIVASTAGGVTPILGCVNTPALSPDWRYLVTATHFVDCGTGQPIAGLSPSIETFTVDVSCKPGQDVAAQVTANVSIPVANAAGYIDIGVGVNVSTPQSGCKVADIDAGGLLHFGQSFVQTASGPTPSAYTGIGFFAPGAAAGTGAPQSSVQQFVGSVTSGAQTDAYFTGLLHLPAAPQSTTLVQVLAQPCPGQMTIQPKAVECVTQATLPNTTSTQVQIADVFASWPGRASVSASISGASTISLDTSLSGPHLSTLTPPVSGYDNVTQLQTISLAPAIAIGLYGSLVHSDELLALVQDPTLGNSMVVLSLDETTGQWTAGHAISLTTFTLAQQQSIGLFGAGGCFAEPIPACAPVAANPQVAPIHQPIAKGKIKNNSGPSATANLSFTHAGGAPVTAANPLHTASNDPLTISLQWSASGLTPGQYAYAAVSLCDPYIAILSNTNGGQKIEVDPACVNGWSQPQAANALALPPIQADASGGISENLQFTVEVTDWFTPLTQSSWTIPATVFVTNSPTPATGDTQVFSSSATLPLTSTRDAMTVMEITSATLANAGTTTLQDGSTNSVDGIVYKLRYSIGANPGNNPYENDFLPGSSSFKLLPPFFTDAALVPKLVQNSLQILTDGSTFGGSFPYAVAAKSLNTNLSAPNLVPDAASIAIPGFTIDNLIGYSNQWGPSFAVSWFAPLPVNQHTYFETQGTITWNSPSGATPFNLSGFSYTVSDNALDISPVPVAVLGAGIYFSCNDGFYLGGYSTTSEPACVTPFNWSAGFEFGAGRDNGDHINFGVTTLFNPDYVIQISPDEHVTSAGISTGVPAGTFIASSDDASCSYLNKGTGIWTDASTTPGRTDWSAVRCIEYHYQGIITTPYNEGFRTQLDASIDSATAVLGTHTTTTTFAATADNVIPDSSGNAWATNSKVRTWKKSTILNVDNEPGTTIGPGAQLSAEFFGAGGGLPLPDLTFTFTIAPGAVWAATPVSFFVAKDVLGNPTVTTCPPPSGQTLTCTVASATPGVDIATPGGFNENLSGGLAHYSFIPSLTYNGAQEPKNMTFSTTASWLRDAAGQPLTVAGPTEYDTIIGPNQLTINKAVHGGATKANSGATVPFDITYGALGLNSGALGAGGVAVYDFFGLDYQPGANGAPGTLQAQSQGCVAPVPVSVSYEGSTGGTSTPAAPSFFYTTATPPGIGSAWTAMPAGAIPAGATAIKIVPSSSLGQAGVLLPVDGTETVQVNLASPAGSTGKLCNSAALTANLFNPTATAEAAVTLNPPCDINPWP